MNRRTKRVAAQLKSEISRVFLEEISDPRLSGVLITDVALTNDLKQARVFFSPGVHPDSPQQDPKSLKAGFRRLEPFLRRRLGESLALRFVPKFLFELDMNGDRAVRVLSLLEQIKVEANQTAQTSYEDGEPHHG